MVAIGRLFCHRFDDRAIAEPVAIPAAKSPANSTWLLRRRLVAECARDRQSDGDDDGEKNDACPSDQTRGAENIGCARTAFGPLREQHVGSPPDEKTYRAQEADEHERPTHAARWR